MRDGWASIHSVTHGLTRSLTHYQVRAVLEEIVEKLPEEFNMAELLGKAEERTPYQVVALQECERMNLLTQEIRRSLRELSLGLTVRRQQFSSFRAKQSGVVTSDR